MITPGDRISPSIVLHDLWLVLRRFRSKPREILPMVGVLGLAVGVATAIFALVDGLFLRPLPFRQPQQLARAYMRGENGGAATVPPPVFARWRESGAFSGVEGARSKTVFLDTDLGTIKSPAALVSPGLFDLLGGVQPIRGRLFDESDRGNDDRVIVSETLWRTRFGADPGLVGRVIRVDGRTATAIGILPSSFHFPDWNTAVWLRSDFSTGQGELPIAYVRFGPEVPRNDALALATRTARELVPGYARLWADTLPLVSPDRDYQRAAPVFVGAAALLFLALCANASGLMLLALAARARELAIRAALGASRYRLIQQTLLESLAVGTLGALLGAGLSWSLLKVARAALPMAARRQSLNPLDIDLRALGVLSAISVVAIICAAVLPVVIGTRVDFGRLSVMSDRYGLQTIGAKVTRRVLLTSQVAISCALLIGATLLTRSFINLVTAERGFETNGILVVLVELPKRLFPTPEIRAAAVQAIDGAARALPGVTVTSWSYGVPPGGGRNPTGDWSSDVPGAAPVRAQINGFDVDKDFFDVYRIPIVRGRRFMPSDDSTTVLISESFARMLWQNEDPVGRTFRLDAEPSLRVAGVVKEVRYPSLNGTNEAPQVYGPLSRVLNFAMLSLRCNEACPEPAHVQQQLNGVQPGAIEDARRLDTTYEAEAVRPRAAATVAVVFAVTALVAAAAGIFGLLSRSVVSRRREIGVRLTFGATVSNIRWLIIREALIVMLPGVAAGAFLGLFLARQMSSLLFNLTTTDPVSWTVVVGVVALTAAAASYFPTSTAIRTRPSALLRDN